MVGRSKSQIACAMRNSCACKAKKFYVVPKEIVMDGKISNKKVCQMPLTKFVPWMGTKRRKNYAKEAAVPAWSEFGHTGLFMLTIIICGLLFAYPRLRDGFDGFNFKIAGRWATQCFLFRARGDAAKGAKILPSKGC